MKRPAKIMLIVLSAVVLAVLVIVANVVRSRSQVRGIEVVIRYGDTPQLVGSQTVVDTVLRSMPNLLQLSVKNVDCKRVASVARRVPFLTQVSASVSVGGKVVVRAGQRRPRFRRHARKMLWSREAEHLDPQTFARFLPCVLTWEE